ncbi:hypothetical protein L211DRAFT_850623 [Terfezia boudieri ATCC MYA-4762]|uniref:Uncharacterized protein n=1 Tax=Terfezia boudieri ATCC MYA-4762 TaxID=1051890 RepID=A0A3N4LI80_9PEZI|nr:hypothetical protein L211DRAFT_850623 [Terfezia boudieri ATCC MYA-4762]
MASTAWEKGPKIDLCHYWVEELKLKEVDPDTKKMKAHVLQMIKKYTTAKKLELSTEFGNLKDITKVKGKIVSFTKTTMDQLLEIYRVSKILDTKLRERYMNSISAIIEIIRKGLREAEMLLDREEEDLDSSPDLESEVSLQKKAQSKANVPISLERATKVSGIKKEKGRDTPQESQVAELTPGAPWKLGVPGSKGYLDLKAAGKRIHAESDSDEKEEEPDDEASHQRKGTKKKKSGTSKLGLEDLVNIYREDNKVEVQRIETAKLK